MVPSRFLLTIASSEDSTIAESKRAARASSVRMEVGCEAGFWRSLFEVSLSTFLYSYEGRQGPLHRGHRSLSGWCSPVRASVPMIAHCAAARKFAGFSSGETQDSIGPSGDRGHRVVWKAINRRGL